MYVRERAESGFHKLKEGGKMAVKRQTAQRQALADQKNILNARAAVLDAREKLKAARDQLAKARGR